MPRHLLLAPCFGRRHVMMIMVRPDDNGMQRRYAQDELAALQELKHRRATTRSRPIDRRPDGFRIAQHA